MTSIMRGIDVRCLPRMLDSTGSREEDCFASIFVAGNVTKGTSMCRDGSVSGHAILQQRRQQDGASYVATEEFDPMKEKAVSFELTAS